MDTRSFNLKYLGYIAGGSIQNPVNVYQKGFTGIDHFDVSFKERKKKH